VSVSVSDWHGLSFYISPPMGKPKNKALKPHHDPSSHKRHVFLWGRLKPYFPIIYYFVYMPLLKPSERFKTPKHYNNKYKKIKPSQTQTNKSIIIFIYVGVEVI